MTNVIAVDGLVKAFGPFRALDGLDLDVHQGEVHGFLGPNGSGKSTTIRVLLGLLRADGGSVSVFGGDPWSDAVALHKRLAYVPGDVNLWPRLTGGETIDLFSRLRADVDPARRDDLLERFELDPTKRARTYSKGNRQKVALVAALASTAELLVLDEPTSGLDPLMEAQFQRCIAEVKAEGRTVLLSSHILAEVEALCDRVSIIRAGKTVQSGTLDELRHLTHTTITAETARPVEGLDAMAGVAVLDRHGDKVRLTVEPEHLDEVTAALSRSGLRSLVSNPPTLEELFLREYGDELPPPVAGDEPAPVAGVVMNGLTRTWALTRFALRRDRVRIGVWLLSIALLVLVTSSSTQGLYPTQADLDQAAIASQDNPAAIAFNGPPVALDTMGGQVAFQVWTFGLVIVGLMSLLMVVRLTRAEEDSGRLELVRSMAVGRHAPVASAVIVVGAMDVAAGLLTTLALIATGIPALGSAVLGASFIALGFVFVGVAAVTAQVTENPRAAGGMAGAVLGLSFVLRAIGDVGDGTLSWFSPIGISQKTEAFGSNTWWPLAINLVLAVALVAGSAVLAAHRDFGAGLVAPRPGPATAGAALGGPLGLAVRLQRSTVFWWTVATLVTGVVYGSLANSIDEFVKDNQAIADILAPGGGSLVDSYLSTSLLVLALAAGGAALQSALRLRTEESAGRIETLLSTPTSRARWMGSHLTVSFAGGAVVLAAGGLGIGVTYAATIGDASQILRVLGASLLYVPAVWFLSAAAAALFGAVPRAAVAAWALLAAALVVAMFGTILGLPGWAIDLSPFQQIPEVLTTSFEALPVLAVLAVTAGLTAIGLASFRHRDVHA